MTKLLSINIRDIRINKDIKSNAATTPSSDARNSTSSASDSFNDFSDVHVPNENENLLDFRNKKVPPSIITFAQFIAVHVHNISIVLMNSSFEPNWFLHATVKELHLDGGILHQEKSLVVTAALNDAQVSVH